MAPNFIKKHTELISAPSKKGKVDRSSEAPFHERMLIIMEPKVSIIFSLCVNPCDRSCVTIIYLFNLPKFAYKSEWHFIFSF